MDIEALSSGAARLKNGVTGHCIVKNEERFVWYAIQSLLPYVDRMLVYDTGSSDRTVDIIKTIESKKIAFRQVGKVSPREFTALRQRQIDETNTEWILLLDGDEVWSRRAGEELARFVKNDSGAYDTLAAPQIRFTRDLYTALDDSEALLELEGKPTWHVIRGFRRSIPGLHVEGDYPGESYRDNKGVRVYEGSYCKRIFYMQNKFFHASDLPRSSSVIQDWRIPYRRGKRFRTGCYVKIQEYKDEIESIFSTPAPVINMSPLDVNNRWASWAHEHVLPMFVPVLKRLRSALKI